MNNFKALIMNADEFVVIISFRWKSPSGTFIRLSKYFILVVPRVDIILSIGLAWLYLERYNQVAHCTCLLKAKWAKCLTWKIGRTLINSSSPSLSPLGLYAQNRNQL